MASRWWGLKRTVTELVILIAGLVVLSLLSFHLATERSDALQNVRRYGPSCMALVDPTVTTDSAGDGPLFQGVDPQTAVFLQRVAPEASAFFHSHWSAQVTVLDGPTYRNCFGGSNSNNQTATDAIFLNRDRLPSPELRAIAIAHELIHAEHGHPDTAQGRHSLRHLLITEEGEAHLADQEAAIRLHTKSLDSPLEAFLFYIGTLPLLYGWCLLTTYRVAKLSRGRSKRRPAVSARPVHFPR